MKTRSSKSVFLDFFLLIGFISLWGHLSLFAQPGTNQIYTGQRLSVFGIKITDQNEKSFSFKYQIVNTGREAVSLGKSASKNEALVVEFDTTNVPVFLLPHLSSIVEALLLEKIALKPGATLQNESLKVYKNNQKTASTSPKKEEKKPKDLPKKPSEPVAQIEDPLPQKVKEPDAPKQKPIKSKDIPQQPIKISAQDTEEIANTKSFQNDPNVKCADLVFDTVYVVKQRKNTMLLHFTLQNNGNTSAHLLGETDAKEDNIAINVYMTSGMKLTRGSFLADGIFIKNKETEGGLLLPGKKLHGELEINTENRTRFTPNLVFELDPFQTVQECNKTNNTKGILVK
jgi:hypothetical protein